MEETKKITPPSLFPDERATTLELGILSLAQDHPRDLARMTSGSFGISRQTAHKHIRALVDRGFLEATGRTKGRRYKLRNLVNESTIIGVTPSLEEDEIWRSFALPYLSTSRRNIREICHYGFTEMVNNVIEHSASETVHLILQINPILLKMSVTDLGVGIFEKIKRAFNLEDPRHALLELSKGKLTTDPAGHTGEGVYFSSRMFDEFAILSSGLYFGRIASIDDQWLIETEDRAPVPGTSISMAINLMSNRELEMAFSAAATEDEDFSFSRTHVPVNLARYGDERLVSRSQAKRVLARFDRFSEVMLDFKGVERIGQAFADEIFRVFQRDNPSIRVATVHTNPEIDQMISRAIGARDSEKGA